jgi:hypothetical protein
MHPLDIEPRDQRAHVGLVLRIGIVHRIRQPIAATASRNIDGDDAMAPRQALGQTIEVMRVARQPMDAQDGGPAVVRAPFEVADAMKAGRAEAEEVVFGERTHRRPTQ